MSVVVPADPRPSTAIRCPVHDCAYTAGPSGVFCPGCAAASGRVAPHDDACSDPDRGVHYASVDDTTWPVNVGALEWRLRYGAEAPGRQDRLVIASVLAAWAGLTDPGITQAAAVAGIKRARRATTQALAAAGG